jgi:hypothetical protein
MLNLHLSLPLAAMLVLYAATTAVAALQGPCCSEHYRM